MNTAKNPKIPSTPTDNKFLINCKNKANWFVNIFLIQCDPLNNGGFIPNVTYLSEARIDKVCITTKEIIPLIRGLNKEKRLAQVVFPHIC